MSIYNDLAAARRTSPFAYKTGSAANWPLGAPEHNHKCLNCAARSPTIVNANGSTATYCMNETSPLHDTIVVGSDGCDEYVYPRRMKKEYKDVTMPVAIQEW